MTATDLIPDFLRYRADVALPTARDAAVRAAYTRGRVQGMQDAMRHMFHRHVVDVPVATRPLFLAPHPDDIIIGCGGTLQKYLAANVSVRLAYLTDGRAAATDQSEQQGMADTRAREADAVSTHLGLPAPHQFGWDETTMCDSRYFGERVRELADLLSEVQPDAVFVPYLWDQHGDHRVANYLLARAMRRARHYPRVYGYEVWSVAPPGVVVDISEQLEGKMELIRLYESQLKLFPYEQMIDIANRTRASLVGPWCSAAEAFTQFDGAAFCDVVDEVDLISPETVHNEVLTTPPSTW